MTIAARTGFLGLVTNVACTQAPAGALQDAENVCIRRAGAVEPRDGVTLVDEDANPAVWGFSLDDDTDIVARWTGAAFTWEVLGGAALQFDDIVPRLGASIDPQPFRRDVLTYARSRGRVYVPTDKGLLRVTDSEFDMAGLPPTAFLAVIGNTTAATWLPNNSRVGYRAVLVRRGDDGFIASSAPGGHISYQNTSGAAGAVVLNVYVHAYQFDDAFWTHVEVYRTRTFSSSVTPDDEMRLIATIPRAEFSLGSPLSYTLTDLIADAGRGKVLYTSPTRGGIDQANNRPPAAAAVAAYKGSVFFGNVRSQRRLVFSSSPSRNAISGVATGIGLRQYTGDTTNASPTVINLSSTVGLERGMVVIGSGIPDATHITAISGTTITLSKNATATAAAAALDFYDAIQINGRWAKAGGGGGDTGQALPLHVYNSSHLNASSHDVVIYNVYPPDPGFSYTWVLETFDRDETALEIRATHGGEYSPPLPTYAETALAADQDVWPGAIMWTKADEPEHVSSLAYKFVGDVAKAVLGLVPTRDALFILKEDGVFRLTGSGATEGVADPWRVDPYDPTTRCLLPTSVKPLNGRAYFLSNKGVVAFGDGGAEPVSKAIHDLVRDMIDQVIANYQSTGFYEVDGVVGSTAAVFERENEYTLLRNSTDPALVYNENTNAWTTWSYQRHASESLSYKGVFTLEREGRVAHALSGRLLTTRLSTDAQNGTLTLPLRVDGELARTASSYSGGVVTLTASTTALEGDVIQDADGKLWTVQQDYFSSTLISVTGPSSAFTTGSCYVYRALRCRVAPQTFFGEPMKSKDNLLVSATFSRFEGPTSLEFQFNSQLSPRADGAWDAAEQTFRKIPLGYVEGGRGVAYFQDTPNDHFRAWLLDTAVKWTMTHGTVRLEGVYLDSRPGKQRARAHEEA